MKRIKWIRETNETLLDLIFGCLIWSALAEIVGVLIVSDKISYTIGIVLGTVVAVSMSVSMERGLEKCLHMGSRKKGQWGMTSAVSCGGSSCWSWCGPVLSLKPSVFRG